MFLGPEDFEELHGDHIMSVKIGGVTTWDNLQLLCGPCNLSKGSR
jgi:5-methylcytosine-specific restriction endonuclease McrA